MGLFKQMKQMKESVAAAPELVQSAMDMQAAAAAPQAGGTATAAPLPGSSGLDDQEISGVTLANYAAVCRLGTERGVTDLPGVAAIAREQGIDAASWEIAMNGWNARFASDTPAAMRFNALWRGAS